MSETKSHILLAGGRIHALRCQALSKRSKQQCKKAASRGSVFVCSMAANQAGPVTHSGKQRCTMAKTIHGRETRSIRSKRAQKISRDAILFWFAPQLNLFLKNGFS